jgi:hypothetical protein
VGEKFFFTVVPEFSHAVFECESPVTESFRDSKISGAKPPVFAPFPERGGMVFVLFQG